MVDLERSTQLTSGPELRDVAANRSEYEPKAGLHYKATDTGAEFIGDGNRWNKIQSTGANPSFRSVDTDELSNVADTIVDGSDDIETVISNLSAGDTVYIGQPDTPFRNAGWLDIAASGVDIIAQSRYAANGDPLIKPQDGADVGGIRIGFNTAVSDVTLRNLGYHGNDTTMSAGVTRLHGFIVHNADEVTIDNCYATRTAPYHQHNDGGSGIAVRHQSTNVTITNCRGHDIGDRFIQASGEAIEIRNTYTTNGYDRSVALDVYEPGNTWYSAKHAIVDGVLADNNSSGSVVGVAHNSRTGRGNYAISNVVAYNSHSRAVKVWQAVNEYQDISITNIVGVGGYNGVIQVDADNVSVSNVVGRGYSGNNGQSAYIRSTNFTIQNLTISGGAATGLALQGNDGVLANINIYSPGGHGLDAGLCGGLVASNIRVRQAGDVGLRTDNPGVPMQFENVKITASDQNATGAGDINIACDDATITGSWATESISGSRVRSNGRSKQSATPGSGTAGDDWGGNETDARQENVLVEDTSVTAPYDLYRADSAGNWVQVG